ncbi:MAG TPA: copper-binding protein [Terriglobales bacterium]
MKAIHYLVTVLLLIAIPAMAAEWAEGEIRRVDAAAGKVTIKHGELKDLKMPAMTMVFTLKDPAWAKNLKPGQEVRFQAKDLGGGKMQVEAIEPKGQ